MEKAEHQRYFIAIVPPAPIRNELDSFKNYLAEHYHAKAALRSPSHLTLHMPFLWKTAKEPELIENLERFACNRPSFSLHLSGFGCFEPRVIFVNVCSSAELNKLQSDLQIFCRVQLKLLNGQYRDLPYHPHVTIAFRDLKKAAFQDAWQEFRLKEFKTEFDVARFFLLRRNGIAWELHREFKF